MANPKFYHADLSLATYAMSATENATYPLANLSNYIASSPWKSSASTNNQWLRATVAVSYFGTTAKDVIIIDGSNIGAICDASGQVQIQSSTDINFTSPTTLWDTDIDGALEDDLNLIPITSSTRRYFRILFVDCASLTPEVGSFYVTKEFDIGTPYNLGYKDGNKQFESITEAVSMTGLIRTSAVYTGGRKVWSFGFKSGNALNNTTKALWITFFNSIKGNYYPFYFLDADGTTLTYVKCGNSVDPRITIMNGLNEIPELILKSQEVS